MKDHSARALERWRLEQNASLQKLPDLTDGQRTALVLLPQHERTTFAPTGAAEPPIAFNNGSAATWAIAQPSFINHGRLGLADDPASIPDDLRHELRRVQL